MAFNGGEKLEITCFYMSIVAPSAVIMRLAVDTDAIDTAPGECIIVERRDEFLPDCKKPDDQPLLVDFCQ